MGVKMCHCLQTFLTWFAVVWRIHHPTGTAFCYEVSTEQYFYLFLNVTSETMWYAVLFCKCWRCFLLLYHPPSSEVCHNGYDSFLLPFVIGDLFNLGTESVICAILKGLMDHILLETEDVMLCFVNFDAYLLYSRCFYFELLTLWYLSL